MNEPKEAGNRKMWRFLQILLVMALVGMMGRVFAQQLGLEKLPKKSNAASISPPERHPLDPALDMGRDALAKIHRDIADYTATIVKRERIQGVLGEHEFMEAKIRNRKVVDGKVVVPLSVYLKFVKPAEVVGREAIWVEGKNDGKVRIYGGGRGFLLPPVWLDPHSKLVMNGQLHPICDIGIENLLVKLIEYGEKEKQYDECELTFQPGAKINGRACTMLRIVHPTTRPDFDVHKSEVFIDDELKLPIRFAAYSWPQKAGEDPPLVAEYTYINLKLGSTNSPILTDADFDADNPKYNLSASLPGGLSGLKSANAAAAPPLTSPLGPPPTGARAVWGPGSANIIPPGDRGKMRPVKVRRIR